MAQILPAGADGDSYKLIGILANVYPPCAQGLLVPLSLFRRLFSAHRGRGGFLGWWKREAMGPGGPHGVPMEEEAIPSTSISKRAPGAMHRAGTALLRELLLSGDLLLELRSESHFQPFLISPGFKAASKFLRSQILAGAARKPSQKRVRAVSVPAAHPGFLLFCG